MPGAIMFMLKSVIMIGAHYHCTVLFVESMHHRCQCIFVFIYIVAVQLNGKFTAVRVMHADVPATAYTQVTAFGDQVDQALVVFKFVDGLGSAVGRMIVDDNQVESEIRFLPQYRTDGIADGADTVAYRR